MTKTMTDLERAVRCLELQEQIASGEAQVLALQAKVAFRHDDDDTADLDRIAELRSGIAALQAEQAEVAAGMTAPPNLADAVQAHAEAAQA